MKKKVKETKKEMVKEMKKGGYEVTKSMPKKKC